jgi:6-phosphogluconate dehydrogenase
MKGKEMKNEADIAVVGLAVMGENLILNMERNGFTVACFNRTTSKVDDFISGRAAGKKSSAATASKHSSGP